MIKSNKKYNLNEIKIELSYKCNLNCIHCSSEGSSNKKKSISIKDALKILDSAAKLNVNILSISGGEPLIWPELQTFLNECFKHKMDLRIYTNGFSDKSDIFLRQIEGEKIKLIFSLHGSKRKTHDYITGITGSFDKTIATIKSSVAKKLSTEIHFVPVSVNYKELLDLGRLSKELKVNKLSILRFVPQGRGAQNKHLELNKLQYSNLRNDINTLNKLGFNIRTGSPFNFLLLNKQPNCTSGIDKVIVAPDLSIYPCDAFKQISVNDIFEKDDFSSLANYDLDVCWEKSKYLKAVREILESQFNEPCKNCKKLSICKSGCLAQKILKYGNYKDTADPSCLILNDIETVREENVKNYF